MFFVQIAMCVKIFMVKIHKYSELENAVCNQKAEFLFNLKFYTHFSLTKKNNRV